MGWRPSGQVISQAIFQDYDHRSKCELYVHDDLVLFARESIGRKIKQLMGDKHDPWYNRHDLQWVVYGKEDGDDIQNLEYQCDLEETSRLRCKGQVNDLLVDLIGKTPFGKVPKFDKLPEAVQQAKGKTSGKGGIEAARKTFETERGGLNTTGLLSKVSVRPCFKHYITRLPILDEAFRAMAKSEPAVDMTDLRYRYGVTVLSMEQLEQNHPNIAKRAKTPTNAMISKWGWSHHDKLLPNDDGNMTHSNFETWVNPYGDMKDDQAFLQEDIEYRRRLVATLEDFEEESKDILKEMAQVAAEQKRKGKGKGRHWQAAQAARPWQEDQLEDNKGKTNEWQGGGPEGEGGKDSAA